MKLIGLSVSSTKARYQLNFQYEHFDIYYVIITCSGIIKIN